MLNRRQAITGAAAAAGAITTRIPDTLAQTAAWRRDVSDMAWDDPDLAAYRQAVGILQTAPRNRAVTWETIVDVHEQRCPHGNWYFLAWHRAYTLMMERIVRDVSGRRNFAMPYWDWSSNPSIPQAFLDPGTQGNPNPLYVSEEQRFMTANMQFPLHITGFDEVIFPILDQTSFRAFASGPAQLDGVGMEQDSADPAWLREGGVQGLLENTPHNNVHTMLGNGVGADGAPIQRPTSGLMAGFRSPTDPLFWVHHCNIDRLWAIWNRNGNQNTADQRWRNMSFAGMFLAPDGTVINDPDTDLTNIARMESVLSLGYTYRIGPDEPRLPQPDDAFLMAAADDSALRRGGLRSGGTAQRSAPTRSMSISARNDKAVTIGQPVEIPITVAANRIAAVVQQPARPTTALRRVEPAPGSVRSGGGLRSGGSQRNGSASRNARVPVAQAPTPGPRVLATIAGLKPPGAKAGATQYRVFINKDDLKPDTPTTDPSYVSSFTFFGAGSAQQGGQLRSGQAGGHSPSHGGGHANHADNATSMLVDLTGALRRLTASGKFKPGDPVRVQIVAVGNGDKAESAIMPARVTVAVR